MNAYIKEHIKEWTESLLEEAQAPTLTEKEEASQDRLQGHALNDLKPYH
jgi:hypothetical protein